MRAEGEENEDAILARVLGVRTRTIDDLNAVRSPIQQKFWRDDVLAALISLGGEAHLSEIYEKVRERRRQNGRSLPTNADAIVRRELEYNSSDATAFRGKFDLFRSVNGIGSGQWAVRSEHLQ